MLALLQFLILSPAGGRRGYRAAGSYLGGTYFPLKGTAGAAGDTFSAENVRA